jgi:gluconolactonase
MAFNSASWCVNYREANVAASEPSLKVVAPGLGFLEGPVFTPDGSLVVCSIDRGLLYTVDTCTWDVRELARTGGGPNGATVDADGVIYVAQNGGRPPADPDPEVTGGIQAVAPDGSVRWVTRDPVSPNDLCFGPDGCLYVTDPTRNGRRDDGRLWRIDPRTGESELLISVPWYPNGIGFTADDELFVASTGEGALRRFRIDGAGLREVGRPVQLAGGLPDGFAFTATGECVVAALSDGTVDAALQVCDAGGHAAGTYRPGLSTHYTNLAFRDDLIVVCDSSNGDLLAGAWPVPGLPLHPFRP